MTALVTGATGFIGRYLVGNLLKRSGTVYVDGVTRHEGPEDVQWVADRSIVQRQENRVLTTQSSSPETAAVSAVCTPRTPWYASAQLVPLFAPVARFTST